MSTGDWYMDRPAAEVAVGNLVDNMAGVIGRVTDVATDETGNLVINLRGARPVVIAPDALVDIYR